jgi:hypothetical protein
MKASVETVGFARGLRAAAEDTREAEAAIAEVLFLSLHAPIGHMSMKLVTLFLLSHNFQLNLTIVCCQNWIRVRVQRSGTLGISQFPFLSKSVLDVGWRKAVSQLPCPHLQNGWVCTHEVSGMRT